VAEESNFAVAEAMLEAASDFGPYIKYRYDNWVGPQLKTLMVRVDDAGALREALSILASLADYPILSDEDYSEREAEDRREVWENCHRPDLESLVATGHGVPEDLFWPDGWHGRRIGQEVFDELAFGCPAWEEWDSGATASLDLDELAGELAGKIRVHLYGEGADQNMQRDCACCGSWTYGPVWELCGGCDHNGGCDAEESWHCTGEFEHACDGTACPETQEEADKEAEDQARREAQRMMVPLF
jgi:hypothetical protein